MITATNLSKRFGDLTAVDNIDLEMAPKQTFGLLGPNGAGKTTTISMLAGVLAPDSGTVKVNGADDPTRSEVRRQLGIAPQALALYDQLTGRENLGFFGKLYGLSGSKLKERVDWALDFVDLTDRAGDKSKEYSGGMQRRLNLACAVVHDPPVLMLDEPTVGVDPQSRNMIFEKIEQFKAEGRTVLYTTHYMEEAERLCDQVAIIDHGKILALDTVDGLIKTHGGDARLTVELVEMTEDVKAMGGEIDGLHVTMQTPDPMSEISRIRDSGAEIRSLRIDRPSLEQVFLNLTGRRLRD